MKSSTGNRLKKLATEYAKVYAELTRIGNRYPEEHKEIKKGYYKAKKKLWDAISELTNIV